ncbi:penicillin amidase [Flavobacterium psychrophilum]|uniref:Penicillin G acylase n=1 Tax=Flavobacterium psychrophilum (strain ATCC 49511 / DSM 21280 / CIP 103535 / JIP02/86) TaxID=402612 RepID=A6H1P5_FLAPJ|nr:penicillin acylase family protein [Flavobacterium psychrophilum]AIG30940.1 penicillin amidase [Flavobacterium psychrophilum]AIG33217.1 penicillin amidase [Flavobacterium psychrophilum]AIG35366.1 penicillin amidase [Flavobacterium psychrophilum]AIG37726.1 penicillin amidase [Flavobacterium psychrophilum]AIG39998.1 penicillin amidase [Flavobacterium psychrophilum]
MKKFKKILFVFVLFIAFIAVLLYGYLLSTKPNYEGELFIKNISKETTVYFDDYGVPHIYAANQKDAMTALGYVHAQDRLWQMELIRRIAPGKLAEIFGTRALKNDKFFIGLGINENSEKAIATLNKNGKPYQMAMAYLDGVNQYLENGKTPIEFKILGIKKEKFTLKDVYNTFGYMAFSFAMAQKTDPLLTDIKNKYGEEYLKDLGIDYSLNTTRIKISKEKTQQYIEISKSITTLLENSPVPPFIGSNSWVLSPKKTKTGKVLFCNDPHIEYSQPGTWYEAHISCPENEMYGYYLAGTPFPLLGHNRDYAYGITMFENDDADLFEEENNPKNENQYKTVTGFQNYKIRTKTIKVKDSTSIILNVKETQHGPIINDLIDNFKNQKPVSFSWIYTQQPNKILDAVYSLSHAKNMTQFQKGVSYIVAPGLNIMYGDAKNNIAWFTSGKLYKLEKGVNANLILNGTNGIDDKKKFLEYAKNPSAINPSWNYVYSSNNMPEAIDGYNYPGYYLPEDRARRITNLLDNKSNWSKEEVSKMTNDNTSPVSIETVKTMLLVINNKNLSSQEKAAINLLKNWKGTNQLIDVAPTIYTKWLYFYLKNTYQDEMGEISFKQFLKTHIMKQSIAFQTKNINSPWWDNIHTKSKKETRSDILNMSFKQAISSLNNQLGNDVNSWTWNKVHKVEYKHPLGSVALFKPFFNVGKFSISGTNEVINNTMFDYSDEAQHIVKAGPSTRRIIDFSDIENSWSILPTGQSGNPMSTHYNDQAEMYLQGKFRKMKLNKEEIIKTSTKLIFKAK